jgi:SAM-dependent methyltransferase
MSLYTDAQRNNYFRFRQFSDYAGDTIPLAPSLVKILPASKDAAILDIGCGFGLMIKKLKALGYTRVQGVDISAEAVSVSQAAGLDVQSIRDIPSFARESGKKYDFIMMSHVLEHIAKPEIIETLAAIREGLLDAHGSLCVIVPNAQSDTGCYYAYEDFTHQTMFTAGSLFYVLKAAGFNTVQFVNPDGYEDYSGFRAFVKKCLLKLYIANKRFWRKITLTQIHRPSLETYTFEIRALASN